MNSISLVAYENQMVITITFLTQIDLIQRH